jgi:ABC-2 type transport system permease protein
MPAVVLPQVLLCGLIQPRDQMGPVLHAVSYLLPLTWAYDALDHAVHGGVSGTVGRDAIIVLGITVAALALGATTLRRRTV